VLQTIEAVIEPDGQVHLLETVPLSGARRALVTILADQPVDLGAYSPSRNHDSDLMHGLKEPNEEWLLPSMQALEAAYGENEPNYALHLIKVWNPEYSVN
jgi:hypothetical protein